MVFPARFCSLVALLATLYYDCVNAQCEGMQVPYGNHCYANISNPGPFDIGETQCNALFDGGHLTSIESQDENDFINATFFTSGYWLGGMRTNGQWYWTDYRPFGYVNWIPGYPLIDFSFNCLAIFPNGSWYNTNCSENMRALCKIPQGSFTPNASFTTTEYTTPIFVADPCIGMDCGFGNCSVDPSPPFVALCICSHNPCYAHSGNQSSPCTVPMDPCVDFDFLCKPDVGGYCRPNITNGCDHECLCPPNNDTAPFC